MLLFSSGIDGQTGNAMLPSSGSKYKIGTGSILSGQYLKVRSVYWGKFPQGLF